MQNPNKETELNPRSIFGLFSIFSQENNLEITTVTQTVTETDWILFDMFTT